jgi:hypothetical protein
MQTADQKTIPEKNVSYVTLQKTIRKALRKQTRHKRARFPIDGTR